MMVSHTRCGGASISMWARTVLMRWRDTNDRRSPKARLKRAAALAPKLRKLRQV
jgi:hypothetical protein